MTGSTSRLQSNPWERGLAREVNVRFADGAQGGPALRRLVSNSPTTRDRKKIDDRWRLRKLRRSRKREPPKE